MPAGVAASRWEVKIWDEITMETVSHSEILRDGEVFPAK